MSLQVTCFTASLVLVSVSEFDLKKKERKFKNDKNANNIFAQGCVCLSLKVVKLFHTNFKILNKSIYNSLNFAVNQVQNDQPG